MWILPNTAWIHLAIGIHDNFYHSFFPVLSYRGSYLKDGTVVDTIFAVFKVYAHHVIIDHCDMVYVRTRGSIKWYKLVVQVKFLDFLSRLQKLFTFQLGFSLAMENASCIYFLGAGGQSFNGKKLGLDRFLQYECDDWWTRPLFWYIQYW